MHLSSTRLKRSPTSVSRAAPIDHALYLARDTAPHLFQLTNFLVPLLPRMPNSSPNIRSFTRVRYSDPTQLAVAIHQPWMALDAEAMRNVLCVDIDHPDGIEGTAEVARQYRLPRPTVIADPWSGRSHAVWVLTTPVCTSASGRQGPQILADLACRLLAAAIRGTAMPPHALIKSPWGLTERLQGRLMHRAPTPVALTVWEAHEAGGQGLLWHTVPGDLRTVELRDVVAALADDFGEQVAGQKTQNRFRRRRGEPSCLGRNCTLFDLVRWWAYDHQETDASAIQAEADRVNQTFCDPLPGSEVAATAKSIASFMASRYRPRTGAASTRGRDRQTAVGLDAAERRALAGRRTARLRVAGTEERISTGVRRLLDEDRQLTQAAVAADAGVSERTVRSRWTRQYAALSGSAGGAARLLPFLSSRTPSLADLAQADRQERETRATIAQLDALTAAARKPGADPQLLPEIPAALSRLPVVRAARRRAEDAVADATRRAADRAARARAAARAEEMRQQVCRGREGWAWWRQHLADLDTVWDGMEADATERERPYLRMQRDAVFGARHRQWQAARRAVLRREPPLHSC